MRLVEGACRKFLALTAHWAWRPTWSLRFGATPVILSAIAEGLKRRSRNNFFGCASYQGT